MHGCRLKTSVKVIEVTRGASDWPPDQLSYSFGFGFFFFFSLFVFSGPHLRHMEVPRLGVESEL